MKQVVLGHLLRTVNRVDSITVGGPIGVKLILSTLDEAGNVVEEHCAVIRARDEELVVALLVRGLLLLLVLHLDHRLIWLPEIRQILKVPRGLIGATFDHEKLNPVHLGLMVMPFGDHRAVLQVPEDKGTVLGGRGEVAVALANLDVDYHIFVPVQRGLEDQSFFGPDLNDAEKLGNKLNLPIVSAGDDYLVLQVELAVVDGHRVAFAEVCVAEHCFHALKLVTRVVQKSVLGAPKFGFRLDPSRSDTLRTSTRIGQQSGAEAIDV